ncbi:MAG: hypothetical protein SRB2_01896 [Desulfobacteraceae bacterium Eth-SRB2]|nr:MAG: hypothetical protein SRB2_01896 [Desulfobacteraceae bacterium Eth-SRB2]
MKENNLRKMISKDISGIYQQIREVLIQARSRAFQVVNTEMVACYWQIRSTDRRGGAAGRNTSRLWKGLDHGTFQKTCRGV